MKKTGYVLLGLISIMALFSLQGCNNHDNEVDAGNYFTYDGNTYDLATNGFIEYKTGLDDGVYKHELIIFSPGIRVVVDSQKVTGKGEAFFLYLNCSENNKIDVGDYQFNAKGADLFEVPEGGLYFNLDYDEDDDNSSKINFTKGTVHVDEKDGTYEMEWTFEKSDGKTITGRFKGSFEEIDN